MTDYEKFNQLHSQERPFLLANAWNVKSAQLMQKAGFLAIGTSSGAIADSLGYADGEKIPFSELLYIVQRIRSSVDVPLSVDFERGYSSDQAVINDHIQRLLDIGVAGINLEDAEGEAVYQKKLSGIKSYLIKTNQQLFINARTDVFLQKLPQPLQTVINRAKTYHSEGANGLFVTGVTDAAIIKEITAAVQLPVNVVGNANLSSVKLMADAGVKRISMAVHAYRATYNNLEQLTKSVVASQSLTPLF
ncbi:isocitrate lyase/phosphoenolpyruvate mutase family protein [Mucilaginibacter terrenus]|uniref:Isocitrate lyase/phosphoenolpyruvate mutase family protein n=1 Tax=Mucilaginibacter terrenus TaxID=2482727 RepID=A0A3E2NTZ9_9SPHI|nr:isocitrate lyase/phosphoenolpyruvate mutase family protein [Mucilaginibacter terrenus]RFZ84495.1 isocitrate lyase/phosphoenolpyruvate mutase family protein [Mucilaginibacter terrenus]